MEAIERQEHHQYVGSYFKKIRGKLFLKAVAQFRWKIQFQKMILFVMLFVSSVSLNYYEGSVNFTISSFSIRGAISHDGQNLYLPLNSLNQTLIYRNTGTNFTFASAISFTHNIVDLSQGSKGEFLLIQTSDGLQIHQASSPTEPSQAISLFGGFKASFSADEEMIVATSPIGISIYQRGSEEYELLQEINDPVGSLTTFSISTGKDFMAFAEMGETKIWIFRREGSKYVVQQTIAVSAGTTFLKITDEEELIMTCGTKLLLYKNEGFGFDLEGELDLGSSILKASITEDLSLIYATNLTANILLQRTSSLYSIKQCQLFGTIVIHSFLHPQGRYFVTTLLDNSVVIGYKCPPQCGSCSFPNNCITCKANHVLVDGVCHPQPTNCVQNVFLPNGICAQYCSRECKTCNTTADDCYECAPLHVKSKEGKCQIQSTAVAVLAKTRFAFNFIRRGSFKFALLAIDDIWLYSYHKKKYDGIIREVLDMIQLIEQRQWEIVGLAHVKEQMEDSIEEVKLYNAYSNKRHMEEGRSNDVFLSSTVDFFAFFLPCLLVFVLLCNRLFYLLFNYRVSSLLRPYSFWGIIFELALQSNIEYFTFLGFRALGIPFSFNFHSKCLLVLSLLVFFCSVITTFCSYFLYYCCYGKLARYFLLNMYRFPSSYALMMFLYGLRPFMKGMAHAIFYHNFVVQLQVLAVIEVGMILLTLSFQYFLDSHKSKTVLVLEVVYMGCLVMVNVLLLLKHHYLVERAASMEAYLQLLVYLMIGLLAVRLFFELVVDSISKDCLKSICCICCKKSTAQVAPMARPPEQQSREKMKVEKVEKRKQSFIQKANHFLLRLYRDRLVPTFTFARHRQS